MSPVRTIRPGAARRERPAPTSPLELKRRDALKFLASGLALTLAGCSRPNNEIVPYVDMPDWLVPGEPEHYATALPLAGYARGVLVKAIDGRPLKVSGNPRHPTSLGSTDVFAESEILSLYDPDRSSTVKGPQPVETWVTFLTAMRPRMESLKGRKGDGLHIVTGRITSPTLLRQVAALKQAYPKAAWHTYDPVDGDLSGASARRRPKLQEADVIVSLDADPLGPGPDQIVNSRAFIARRRPKAERPVSRLYVLETSRTLTGANADHRLSLAPKDLNAFAEALAGRIENNSPTPPEMPEDRHRLLDAIVKDMTGSGRKAIILAGETLPQKTRERVERLNDRLGVTFDPSPAPSGAPQTAPLSDFWSALDDGRVSDLVCLDCNPVHDFPDDRLKWAISHTDFSFHAGTHVDETAEACGWHLPLSHLLESWSDLAATDGTISIVQPLIRPLYETRTASAIVALMLSDAAPSDYEIVRATWQQRHGGSDFEGWWREALLSGVVPATRGGPGAPADTAPPAPEPSPPSAQSPAAKGAFTAVIRPDPTIYDGRFANNAWLQECPKPITKTTWSNIVTLSPGDARRLKVKSGDVVAVESVEGHIEGPAHVDKGQADGIVGLTLGYGRTRGGSIGTGLGYNARALSPRAVVTTIPAVTVKATGRRDPVPSTQGHFKLEGEKASLLPRVTEATDFELNTAARKDSGQHFNHPHHPSDGYAWAMVIDTAACIGCNACVLACQVENNIPVVGPEEVGNHRIMHWLRIDRYETEEGPTSIPGFEPVPCMQCEKAPCEPVCPVEASVHDIEGLNNQVYNRCVGTRFCQSNCPYKVRRFNWFAYGSGQEYKNLGEPPMAAEKNPDVTVRARGVMEKCTYCVQRISRARINAEKTDVRIPDGGVTTACQDACPTRAITFGNLEDLGSNVSKLRLDPRHFSLLEELGTAPRTTYLARLRNPNPDLEKGQS
ncbi:MAG: 4Fe-4S dicluster domain-containing protein [Pararhizobium sp.]